MHEQCMRKKLIELDAMWNAGACEDAGSEVSELSAWDDDVIGPDELSDWSDDGTDLIRAASPTKPASAAPAIRAPGIHLCHAPDSGTSPWKKIGACNPYPWKLLKDFFHCVFLFDFKRILC